MRWGIYSYDGFQGAQAWKQGLSTLGHVGVDRSLWDYREGQIEDFDVVVTFGLQGRGKQIVADHRAAGHKVVVIDYGYLKRTNSVHDWKHGTWQVSVGGLNKLPTGVDGSRFDALGLTIKEHGFNPRGKPLLCVQTAGDASHGFNADQLKAWAGLCKLKWPDIEVRKHPMEPDAEFYVVECPHRTLSDALAACRFVVTGNSNVGHDALMAGVPVVDTFMGAAWHDLSGEELPSIDQRRLHFNRCAWGQWTWAEFEQGLPQRFLLDQSFEGFK